MAKPLVPDALWERIEPLLPPPKPRRFRHPGRKPLTDRQALTGIVFVLKTGITWNDLPCEMRCGSGSRCRRRLAAWHQAGVWAQLHALLLDELRGADRIDWSRAAVDSSTVRALGGGEETGPNPTDRGRPGTKHHAVVDAHGIPLAASATAANVPEVTQVLEVVDAIPDVRGQPGHPKRRPGELYGDRAYDSEPHREALRGRGVEPQLARRNTPHGSGLGVYRWVAERFFSWLHGFRKLRLRTDRQYGLHDALLKLACALICLRFLPGGTCP
jgi:transposase